MPRLNTIKGIWADAATTTIPGSPATGVAYRDTTIGAPNLEQGWQYDTVVDSKTFNQALFELYSVVLNIEQYGVALYSALTDYPIGALCTRTDGSTMKAAIANGPATALKDPDDPLNIPGSWVILAGSAVGTPNFISRFGADGNLVIGSLTDDGDGTLDKPTGGTDQIIQTIVGAKASKIISGITEFGYLAGNDIADTTNIGHQAGSGNTGLKQTAVGRESGMNNTGTNQTAFGYQAGKGNTGTNQTAFGYQAGNANIAGENTSFGRVAGSGNIGANQTAIGSQAGQNNTSGDQTAVGYLAGNSNTGQDMTAVGSQCGQSNDGDYVSFLGSQVGQLNIGNRVVAIGVGAAISNVLDDYFELKNLISSATPLLTGDFANGYLGIGKVGKPVRALEVVGEGSFTDLITPIVDPASSLPVRADLATGRLYTPSTDLPELSVNNMLHVREEQASGISAGTFTAGAWQTRTLNVEKTNTIVGAALAIDQITLPAGDYVIFIKAPGHRCNSHQMKLYNITNSIDLIVGSPEYSNPADVVSGYSWVYGEKFTLTGTKILEVQHQCSSTRSTDGFGIAAAFGLINIYTEVVIYKVG